MSTFDDLPPLRDVIARHQIAAKRSLGQNFLLDLNLTSRIARSAGALNDVTVIEIGPGPGGLTRALLAEGAAKVVVVERDRRCIAALEEISERWPGRLRIIHEDALTLELQDLAECPTKVVANLPYNIATPLLIRWLTPAAWPPQWQSLTLMFQREVAERIVARPKSKSFGRLAVLAGWRAQSEILFDIDPRAFTPPPKVTSSVIALYPNEHALRCDPKILERITASAFGQRRKMLRQSLKSLGVDSAALLEATGVDGTARAEEIGIEAFIALANAYAGLVRPT